MARDVTHLGVIKRDLERYGVQVVFRKLPGEESPTHNLMVNILGSFAEFERELIADRTRRGKRHKVEVLKQYIGSTAPFGYVYVRNDRAKGGGTLMIHEAEAMIVRQMYLWVDKEGLSARKVVARLNRSHLMPRKGSRTWAKSSVIRILRSEVYSGIWHYYKHQGCVPNRPSNKFKYRKSLKSSSRLRPRTEWLPITLPESLRIIPRDQWRRVQVQLDRNIAFSPRNEKHAYLLKGLVRCGACGSRVVGNPGHGKFYYRCMSRCKRIPTIQEHRLNAAVWASVEKAMLNPDLIAEQLPKLRQKWAGNSEPQNISASEIEKALVRTANEEPRLLEAYKSGFISLDQFGQEMNKIKVRSLALEKHKREMDIHSTQPSQLQAKESIVDYCRRAAMRLRSFRPDERQRFLRTLVREILFDGRTIRIKGSVPVHLTEITENSAPNNVDKPTGSSNAVSDCGLNATDIATTTLEDSGRNEPLARQRAGQQKASDAVIFSFELVEPVPRLSHSHNPTNEPTKLVA